MNIQIFGKSKCFDTKKAERYFKERRIKYQFVDILKYRMSRGELNAVKNAVGLEAMVNTEDEDYPLFRYLASTEAKMDKLYEVPYLLKTPIVRNGKQATVGYCPEVWKVRQIANMKKELTEEEEEKMQNFLDRMDENDDVQNVWHNADM